MSHETYINSLPLIPEWNEGKELGVVDLMTPEEISKVAGQIDEDPELGIYYRLVKNALKENLQPRSRKPERVEINSQTGIKGTLLVLKEAGQGRLLEKLNNILGIK